MRDPNSGPSLRLLVFVAILLLHAGCIKAPNQTEFMRQTNATDMTTVQLRLQVRGFLDRYMGVVEDAANEIMDRTDDPELRRNALLWKSSSISAGQKAVFQFDPLAALVDIWVLCRQQEEFFVRGAGRDLFGKWQGIALDASSGLVEEVVALAASVRTDEDVSETRVNVDEWVVANPIESIAFSRASPRPVLARLLGPTARGTSALIGGLNESVADMTERLAVYGSMMPDQARWQAELVIDEWMRSGDVRMALDNTSSLADSLERTAVGLEELPDDVTAQVVSSLSVLEQERAILTRFVERQRIATQEFVREERIAIVQAVQHELEEALARVGEERIDTLDRFDELAAGLMDRAAEDVRVVIDHTLWQAAKLLAGLMVVFGILAIVGLRVLGVGRSG